MKETTSLTKAVARRLRAANWIVAGAAILALAAFAPSRALAQTLTLSPPNATNLAGSTHTVTATLTDFTGHCAEDGVCIGGGNDTLSCKTNSQCPGGTCSADGSPSDDGSFLDTPHACTSDTDCDDPSADDFCSFSGQPIAFQVIGQNSANTLATDHLTDALGNASFTYSDTNGVGLDNITACADLNNNDAPELADECLSEVGGDATDIGSNTVLKLWVAKVMLTPATALNPIGATHTVTAQVAGVCAESIPESDFDGEGSPCISDAQCLALDSGGADEFCDFSSVAGQPIYIGVVGGPNNGAFATQATVGANGQATFQYSSTIPGVDTIQACLDTDSSPDEGTGSPAGDLVMCITDSGFETGDTASNQVTKHWFGPPTVSLTPTSAANPTTTDVLNPSKHTLTATISGGDLGICKTSNNDGAACNTATDCGGGSAVCDLSGFTIEFGVNAGPNAGDLGSATTDVTGAATKMYSDGLDAAGLDTLQACLDTDVVSGDGGSETAADCIGEAAGDAADVPSNLAYKRWEGVPTLLLQNLDLGATLLNIATGVTPPQVYTILPAFNPVATSHTVLATIGTGSDADLGVCVGGPTPGVACDANADCGTGGTCNLGGYPIGFLVVSGPNAGTSGFVNSLANGTALFTYPDNGGAGQDTISACLDTDIGLPGSGNDEVSVAACLADSIAGEGDFASNAVIKNWLQTFVTGGGKVINGKTWDTFGGVVGQKPNSTAFMGEWQQQAHAAKGGNTTCHWNMFSAFALSCSIANCGTQPNTVVFTTAGGSLACGNETVKIVDGQKKPDTIQVVATNPALNVPASSLVSGNFTIHK